MYSKGRREEDRDSESARSLTRPSFLVVLSFVVLTLFGGLAYLGWGKFGHLVRNDTRFQLRAEKIEVTNPPASIRTDIVSEVMRDGSLDEISLLDPEASLRIQQAFGMHHWIESVNRISKHADGHVQVNVTYRQPVGWVLVENGHLPVDKAGIVLPHRQEDLNLKATTHFPLIDVGKTWPLGLVGTSWGDERVLGAARIAAAFGPAWNELGLSKKALKNKEKINSKIITAASDQRKKPHRWQYEIITALGQRIIWGHAPQAETRGEAAADEKVDRLVEYVASYGSLDRSDPSIQIDLRREDTIRITQQPNGLDAVQ